MEIRQLQYFVAAAQSLNFTEAAKQCFITQSTLSHQIKTLENELEIPLFNRVGKSIENLTEGGRIFLEQAQKMLKIEEETKQALTDLGHMATGELRIGVTYALSFLLIKNLAHFAREHNSLQIYVEYGTSSQLIKRIENNDLDFIMTFTNQNEYIQYERIYLLSSLLVVAVSKDHPLASKNEITVNELAQHELILPGTGYSTRSFVDALFSHTGIKPKVRMELNDVPTMLSLIENGTWACILTEQSLKDRWSHLHKLTFKDDAPFTREAYILRKKERYLKKSAQIFIQQILSSID